MSCHCVGLIGTERKAVFALAVVVILGAAVIYYQAVQLNKGIFVDVKEAVGLQTGKTQKSSTETKRAKGLQGLKGGTPDLPSNLKNLRKLGLVDNLARVIVDKMSNEELLLTIHSYLDNTNIGCRRKLRMGTIGDGGWEICDDKDVRPKNPCIIYSFGINYEFSFDDDAARVYGCHVYSFDPSMSKMETQNRSDHVHFYRIGLGGRPEITKKGWQLKTLGDIRAMLGHTNTRIDVLKMDIESAEWPSIPGMVKSGQLSSVSQILMEYHVISNSRDYLLPRMKAIQMIEKEGFRKFYVHKNPACKTKIKTFPVMRTMCYEVHYLKR